MDPRRLVIAAVLGCAFPASAGEPASPRPYAEVAAPAPAGPRARESANAAARAPSEGDRFEGGVLRFAWSPGRVYEVWAAPLRVTTLTLGAGETLTAKAAGDTVRWQMAEARSGEGGDGRTHVLLKPLQRGLETNLVLTTDRHVYLVALRSGGPDGFNAAVAWDLPAEAAEVAPEAAATAAEAIAPPTPVAVNTDYRIETRGRRPAWTPTAVFDDGRRTFIVFPPSLSVGEAPALFVLAPGGEAQFVNYRQAGAMYVVDRVFDQAELRLGDRRPRVVRLRFVGARS